jgi:putative nucleotidyltransferase with HDIG domain
LADRLDLAFEDLGLAPEQKVGLTTFLSPLQMKSPLTYEHSLRVSFLTKAIGRFIHLDQRALFYAGLLHDVGKAMTRLATLNKTADWTPADADEIKAHVLDGYRLVRDVFDFSAEIILWHHRFQQGGYPEIIPEPLHDYSQGTRTMIPFYGRMLSLADVYDALHRINAKFGALSGEAIRDKMLAFNPDQRILVGNLYEEGILTTYTVPEG